MRWCTCEQGGQLFRRVLTAAFGPNRCDGHIRRWRKLTLNPRRIHWSIDQNLLRFARGNRRGLGRVVHHSVEFVSIEPLTSAVWASFRPARNRFRAARVFSVPTYTSLPSCSRPSRTSPSGGQRSSFAASSMRTPPWRLRRWVLQRLAVSTVVSMTDKGFLALTDPPQHGGARTRLVRLLPCTHNSILQRRSLLPSRLGEIAPCYQQISSTEPVQIRYNWPSNSDFGR